MGRYSTKSKSNKWTIVTLCYQLDTGRVNSQTTWSLANGIDPRSSDSFDFGIEQARGLVLPHIENRPLIGLQGRILLKMSFMLNRPVGRFGAQGGIAGAAGAAVTAVQSATAAARDAVRSMTKHAQHSDKRKRCRLCFNQDPKQASLVQTCCGSCGEHCCKSHHVILCTECANLFAPSQ